MITDEIRAIIKEREQTDDEWDYGVQKCLKKEIKILTRNIDETIDFLRNECTFEEFDWITEVIDEVAAEVQSMDYLNCLYEVNDKFVKQGFHDNRNIIKYADLETLRPYERYIDESLPFGRADGSEPVTYITNDRNYAEWAKQRDAREKRFQEVLADNPDSNKLIQIYFDDNGELITKFVDKPQSD